MFEIRVLGKIEALPQAEETLADAFGRMRQLEEKRQAVLQDIVFLLCGVARAGYCAAKQRCSAQQSPYFGTAEMISFLSIHKRE